jgi:hypothetical protein
MQSIGIIAIEDFVLAQHKQISEKDQDKDQGPCQAQ